MNILRILSLVIALVTLQACSGNDNSAPVTTAEPSPQGTAQAPQEAAPEAVDASTPDSGFSSARVFIVSPANGASLTSPVTVVFGMENFGLAPAGTFAPDTGHHHLLIDTALPPLTQPIPADANHLHFGKAQTEAILELAPGEHTLQLVLGDGYHVPHDPALVSEPITITVTEPAKAVE